MRETLPGPAARGQPGRLVPVDGTTKPAPEKWVEPEAPARDDVKVDASPLRCPYCHEGVAQDQPGWVACGGCLARHHGACWDERGACASCNGTKRLVVDERRPPSDPEVVAMVARGDRAGALQALRARGLDERAANIALDLAQAAVATTGLRVVHVGPAEVPDPGRWPEAIGWWLQTVTVLIAACVALFGEAEASAGVAVGGLALGGTGLVAAGILGGSTWSRVARGLKVALNVGLGLLGALLIDLLNIPANRPSPALFLFGLFMVAVSAAFAGRANRALRRPTP